GEPRWKRRLRGAAHPATLWPVASGVLRGLPGEGLALVKDGGALAFRARLPGGAPLAAAQIEEEIVAVLASGSIAGLDPTDGRILWKRACKASSMLPLDSRALLVCKGGLACLEAGAIAWEKNLPWIRDLALSEDGEILIASG